MKLPKARNKNVVINELEKELLIYDLSINKAFCLNETTAIVFNACGTNRTFDDLKSDHNFTNDIVYLALDELRKNDLLAETYDSPFAGMSRREAVKKVGFASMIALPIISSMIAPSSANAASGAAPGTVINFRTPAGTPQTYQQCINAINAGDSRCANNNMQLWNVSGTDNARTCEGRCVV